LCILGKVNCLLIFVYFNFDRRRPLTLKNSGIHVKQLYSVVFEVLSSITVFILED